MCNYWKELLEVIYVLLKEGTTLLGFENIPGWTFYSLFGQPAPVLNHSYGNIFFSYTFSFFFHTPCHNFPRCNLPVAYSPSVVHLQEVRGSVFSLSSC